MSFGASILYVSSPYPGFHCRRVVDVVDVHLPTDFLQKAIHSTKELRTADSDKQTPQENPTKSSSYGNRSKKTPGTQMAPEVIALAPQLVTSPDNLSHPRSPKSHLGSRPSSFRCRIGPQAVASRSVPHPQKRTVPNMGEPQFMATCPFGKMENQSMRSWDFQADPVQAVSLRDSPPETSRI